MVVTSEHRPTLHFSRGHWRTMHSFSLFGSSKHATNQWQCRQTHFWYLVFHKSSYRVDLTLDVRHAVIRVVLVGCRVSAEEMCVCAIVCTAVCGVDGPPADMDWPSFFRGSFHNHSNICRPLPGHQLDRFVYDCSHISHSHHLANYIVFRAASDWTVHFDSHFRYC